MIKHEINFHGSLNSDQVATLKAKLCNPQEVSVVSVAVIEDILVIGYNENEVLQDWATIGKHVLGRSSRD